MQIELSNSIINISSISGVNVICNPSSLCIEISDNNTWFTLYPETPEKLKEDYIKIKGKICQN